MQVYSIQKWQRMERVKRPYVVTVNWLAITGTLLLTLESSNPFESMIEIVRDHSRRVRRWQHGEMVLQSCTAEILAAEAPLRRVNGREQLPALLAALETATAGEPGLLDLTADTVKRSMPPRSRPVPGLIESTNTKIRVLHRMAFGFRSPDALCQSVT